MKIKNITRATLSVSGVGGVAPDEVIDVADAKGIELLRCKNHFEEVTKSKKRKPITDSTAGDVLAINVSSEDLDNGNN